MAGAEAEESPTQTPSQDTASGRGSNSSISDLPAPGTPQGDKLYAAHRAFEAGDFRRVRRLCDELTGAGEPEVADAARALRRRVGVDPVQVGVVLGCSVVFLVIVYLYVLQ